MTIEQFIIGYFIIINAVTFLAYGLDKAQARSHRFRTPEKTLWLLALIGGSPAALLAMNQFRHKTKKLSFQLPLILIIAAQIAAVYGTYSFFFTQ
jgi:uncharacterized membrane protein YsdA (DUF1294 family)